MAAAKNTDARIDTARERAATAGMLLEVSEAGFRMVVAETGTLAAAVWTAPDGYGLTLDEIEAILDGTYVPSAPPAPVVEPLTEVLISTTD
jgi:hypothetical protein